MAEAEPKFEYFLETVNNGAVEEVSDTMAYLFESGQIARGVPHLGVVPDQFKGRQALWVTRGTDTIFVAPATVEGDEVVVDKNRLITPFRTSVLAQRKPYIDIIPSRIALTEVTIPDPVDHPDKI